MQSDKRQGKGHEEEEKKVDASVRCHRNVDSCDHDIKAESCCSHVLRDDDDLRDDAASDMYQAPKIARAAGPAVGSNGDSSGD